MLLNLKLSLRIDSSRYSKGIREIKIRNVKPLTGHENPSAIPVAIDKERCLIDFDICTNLIFLKLLQLLYC